MQWKTYPKIIFVVHRRPPDRRQQVELTGDLTIKGVTNTDTIPFTHESAATDLFGNLCVGFEGSVTISRNEHA